VEHCVWIKLGLPSICPGAHPRALGSLVGHGV
jgi:hypothetical protein